MFSILMSFFLVTIIYIIFYLMSLKLSKDKEISSCYECGFDPLSNIRMVFSYRFFLLSILFLVFDVEIVLFLISPYLILNMKSLWLFIFMMMVLIFGLIYEWFWGSLDWL